MIRPHTLSPRRRFKPCAEMHEMVRMLPVIVTMALASVGFGIASADDTPTDRPAPAPASAEPKNIFRERRVDRAALPQIFKDAAAGRLDEPQLRREFAPLPRPRPVKDGVAEVAEENTLWVPRVARFLVAHDFSTADPKAEITKLPGIVGDLLRQWRSEGTAAGLRGVLYDNYDADHSNMDYASFPELTRLEYSAAAKSDGMHAGGMQILFLHGAPVIGNASVAMVAGPYWRSIPRRAMVDDGVIAMLADQYANNMLYFHPEHADHDPEPGGHGDVYPANIPYMVVSQGSSGSDRAFMNAIAATIAAFRPETQKFLVEKRLLIPTVQWILRSSRKPIAGRDEYLTGAAHPSVFDGNTLDVERMVRMAHDLAATEVPPMVRIDVEEEYLGRPGIDYFEAGPAEKIFDTFSSVARATRSARERRRMVVSAAETRDPNGRPVSFLWKLLRGDPARVRITPLDAQGTRAEILVDWHPRAVQPGSELPSARVDVGVFADNGARLSAPAFITWYFPPNERRTYEDVPAGAAADRRDEINGEAPRRIVSIERLPAGDRGSYVDPLVLTPADWTDTYRYDDRGTLLGWTRKRRDGSEDQFAADGRMVITNEAAGEPATTVEVRYVREHKTAQTAPVLREQKVTTTAPEGQ
jgi:hypothetical protein